MTFGELTKTDKPVLVDFYADWCAPCRAMKPVLDDLKTRMDEKVVIYKIDVDKNQTLAQRFQVRSIPTLILFKAGEPVWRKSGMASIKELENAIHQVMPHA
jgi:thioredoxin 1